jgi:hypothetical protein
MEGRWERAPEIGAAILLLGCAAAFLMMWGLPPARRPRSVRT